MQALIDRVRIAAPVLDKHGLLSAKQLDGTLAALRKEVSDNAQGFTSVSRIRVKFGELLPALADDVLIPLTGLLIDGAPAATFQQLNVFEKTGKLRGVIKRKYRRPNTASGGPSTENGFISGVMLTSGTHLDESAPFGLSQGSYYLRWSEIKDRVAFEISAEKLSEDAGLERSRW